MQKISEEQSENELKGSNNKQVSVIIPVFNNVKTLKKCVDSVISQTYRNIEIILVDDGSTDSSSLICDEYSETDSRVFVLHNDNGKVAYARNQGIKTAKGEYITFIDSDDYISPEYIEKLVSAIENENCILAMCNSYDVNGTVVKEHVFSRSGKCSVKEFLEDSFYGRAEGGKCWGKIYKTGKIKNLFREYNYCEDAFLVFDYLSENDGYVTIVTECLYYYVKRENSITGLKTLSDLTDAICACEEILEICNEKYPEFIEAASALLLNNAFFVYLNIKNDTGSEGECLKERAVKIIKKYRGKALQDKKATAKTKIACLISCISFKLLQFIYNKIL